MNYMVVCLVTLGLVAVVTSGRSYLGQNFVFGILPSFCPSLSAGTKIYLEISSKDAGSLVLYVPALNISGKYYALQTKRYTKIELDHTIQYFGSTQGARGISIYSTTDISVLVTYAYFPCCGMASYRVYPVSVLGSYYIAASYPPAFNDFSDYFSHLMVVAVENNTQVTINGRNVALTKTLNTLEVYQYQSPHGQNMTGIVVTANKDVTVLSGSGFAHPYGYKHGAPMLAQMIPRKYWSQRFVAVEGEPASSMTLRLLSSQPSLTATLINSMSTQTLIGKDDETIVHSSPTMVTSDYPMEVVQNNGEYMTLVPGVSQYMNEYSFVLPKIESKSIIHKLIVIVPTEHKDGIHLDGLPFTGPNTILTTPHGQFTIMPAISREGYHEMVHTNPRVTFAVLAFGSDKGNTGSGYTYGFYVGMAFGASAIATPSSTTSTTSATSATPVVEPVGRMCFTCHDTDRLEYCNVIQNCSVNEVCFVKRRLVAEVVMYTSGCVNPKLCDASLEAAEDSCMECCENNFCNNRGCGDAGIAPKEQRGPLCFDCQHISSPYLCPTLALCKTNQLCSIEEFEWGSSKQYRLGCFSETCTRTTRSVEVDDEHSFRSVPVRHNCCGSDFCNRNASRLSSGFIGTGGIIGWRGEAYEMRGGGSGADLKEGKGVDQVKICILILHVIVVLGAAVAVAVVIGLAEGNKP